MPTESLPPEPAPVLRVGCAMWANRDWVGRYFRSDTPKGHEMRAYRTWCTAVEGNTTFYGLPAASTVKRWAADTPNGFRFMFKLPRTITHDKRLRSVAPELAETMERLEPLRDRVSPLQIQLPGTFGPGALPALNRFLQGLPHEWDWGVEVRHPEFCAGGEAEAALNNTLADRGVERIIIDTRAVFAGPRETPEEQEAFARKPKLTVRPVAIGQQPVVRFIGQTAAEANPEWWSKWVTRVAQWLGEGRTPTVFIHTPDNAVAPQLARDFHAEVAALVPQLAPLPVPEEPETQMKLI